MKHVGTADIPNTECGYALTPDHPCCRQPVAVHGIVEDTHEGTSFIASCSGHAHVLYAVADGWHDIDDPCLDITAYWLTRTDGSSFCYHPATEAELHEQLAKPEIALASVHN